MRHTRHRVHAPQRLRPRGLVPTRTRLACWLVLLWVGLAGGMLAVAGEAEGPHAGFLFDKFELTLAPGHRTEALGPLFYTQQKETQHIWAVPPILSYTRDPATETKQFDFLYPVMTYDRYGDQYRWQFCQIFSFAGGPMPDSNRHRFTLFPLYFQQRSTDPSENYTALFPFYGHLQHRLARDRIFFVMFPLYGQTQKKDVVTDNYLWPFFDLRHGRGLRGWQFWPLVGNEHKDLTTETNGFGDVTIIGAYDKFFAVWPLFFNDRTGLGTPKVEWRQASLPAYAFLRSPARDSTTVLWPFFNHVIDREKQYREWDAPWPLIVFAHGKGKTMHRVWPFYSHGYNAKLRDDFWFWPVYKFDTVHSEPLDSRRTRICFFLYQDLTEKNTETGHYRRQTDLWPFFLRHRDFNGNTRLQILALLEPFTSNATKIERDYSPLWSLWRSEYNPDADARSQSLLWNLYRHETTPTVKKCSLLFGLFQYQSSSEGKRVRLFYIPLSRGRPPAQSGALPQPAKGG
jgi:hypothetical protein